MIEIEKPKIECVEDPANGTYGKFTVEPLERGYGITLGNALRRIMLSSLPGTAATSIKIAGVQHEFSTIPGVKEDVTEIVLNVKSLITRLHNTDGIKTVYIEAVGPCEVKAGDIKGDSEVEVLNPDLHIATLDAGATLNMELTLSHGRGYVSADRNKALRGGVIFPMDIPLDASEELGFTHSERIAALVADAIEFSQGKERICQSPEKEQALNELKDFMFDSVYTNPLCKGEEGKAQEMLRMMFEHYRRDPNALPADFQDIRAAEGDDRAICDYIAGMTDRYAKSRFQNLFEPHSLHV